MPTKWYQGQVKNIIQESPTVRRFFLEVLDEETFPFIPGQFITVDLPISEKRTKRWRSYSIASHPDGSNMIELCIVKLEDGAGSTYLFEEVEVGSTLKFKGPSGAFCLPKVIDHDIVMICTGTGLAPFRSMIHDIFERKLPHRKLHLIFGSRKEADILYREELEELSARYPEFQYDICLSRSESWEGYRGYVHQVYMQDYPVSPEETKFYICGWSQMVDEAVEKLFLEKKVDRKNIIYELYG